VIPTETSLSLTAYSDLIRSLPYMQQAFETKRSTWEREDYKTSRRFQSFLQQAFENDTIKISRGDLFYLAEEDYFNTLFAIILWGYPRNMRGNGFKSILMEIEEKGRFLPNDKTLPKRKFLQFMTDLSGTGIGLSTVSKFLYFLGYSLDGNTCLILDRRIIEVINRKIFSELSAFGKIHEQNKNEFYCSYLQKIHELAKAEGFKPDQLELFLFQFGNNLKSTVVSTRSSGEVYAGKY
jgi:hypothetical protein